MLMIMRASLRLQCTNIECVEIVLYGYGDGRLPNEKPNHLPRGPLLLFPKGRL